MKTLEKCTLITLIMITTLPRMIHAQKANLTDDDVKAAILTGQKKPSWGSAPSDGIGVGLVEFSHSFNWMDVYVYTPIEWIKWQSRLSSTNLKPFMPSQDDMAPVLRVIVMTGTSDLRYSCSQVSNVVLRDVKKSTVAQPISYTPAPQEYQNFFGATQMCTGAIATFGMDDLAKVRSMDPKKEFFIAIAVQGGTPIDRKLKEKEFSHLD